MTESEVVEIIRKVVNKLAYKFRFGYHDLEDIKQTGFMFAIEGMDKYDETQPLINFLYVHVKNRLANFKRNNYERLDSPCDNCQHSNIGEYSMSCAIHHTSLEECPIYSKWVVRNNTKKNLMCPIEFDMVNDEHENGMSKSSRVVEHIINQEIFDIIETSLPVRFRKDWILWKNGEFVPKTNRIKLLDTIYIILEEHNIDVTATETW